MGSVEVAVEGLVKLEVHLGAVEEMAVAVLYLQSYMKLSPVPLMVVVQVWVGCLDQQVSDVQ